MKSKNRVTPFLVITLIVMIIILIVVILIKLTNKNLANYKNLTITDDLVMELFENYEDEDIILLSSKRYTKDSLPSSYIFRKATKFMTSEDVEFKDNKSFIIDYDAVDSGIKTAFGPDFKYDIKKINDKIVTDFELEDKKLIFEVNYDASSNTYVGTYSEDNSTNAIKVSKKLLSAYKKSNIIYLKIGYQVYREADNKIILCEDVECTKDGDTIDTFDNYEYKKTLLIGLKKASDEAYYYNHSN